MDSKYRVFFIGNAHLDPVWLWRWQEGYAEIKATFQSALDRMEEFPDFVFTCACAAYYKWVEENAPEMFEDIKRRVKEGRWVIVGGWWIQPDCNIPSGESFARQGLYSQRYFNEKLGVMAKVGYNVDSFGHNGMIPQILKKSGMDYYVFMRPDKRENTKVPGELFLWESEDNSQVMTYRIPTSYANYGGQPGKGSIELQKLNEAFELSEENGYNIMSFFGVGNHGGGPTITNIHTIHELQKEYGINNVCISSPNEYFEDIIDKGFKPPVYKNDLQHHASGCYSTHSETKASNRRSEHRLLAAEKFMTLAYNLKGLDYKASMIQRAWEKVMFNQFHDIMGGCSIKEAYEDARESYGEALNIGAELLNSSLQKLSWSIDTMGEVAKNRSKEKDWYLWETSNMGSPVVVFNPLSWEINAPIQVNKMVKSITDDMGNAVEMQVVRGPQSNGTDKWNTLFMAKIPAMGYRVYWMYISKEVAICETKGMLIADNNLLENDYLRIEFDLHTGYIKKLYDKKNNVDILSGNGAVPVVIDTNDSDTWAHGIFEFRNELARFSDAELRLIETGPIRAKLRVTNKYNNSILRQDFILYRDKADIEVQVKLDWREKLKRLKLSFPVNVTDAKATYEIPYGFIEKPVNGEEEVGQQWIDVTGTSKDLVKKTYGLSLLNDSKYSFDIKDNDMRMSIVNSSIFADHFSYQTNQRDELCEYMDQGIQEFKYVLYPHLGDWKDSSTVKRANELNEQPASIMETYHKGTLPPRFNGINISGDNIIATAFKRAEDADGYILRCYETSGRETDAFIELPMLGRKWATKFGKCEIKTFFISDNIQDEVQEKNLLEM